ncbi:hypothetical protein FB567DRAFT_203854 [Paraphoma chrysanthemicola]|uniref:Uncharacterized protein n=1 Tax=Paraphoma chrysanthemicola TaxID=798071 RepID=A0A8K0VSZ2_9PLEO|nr:hypothetical protein FB567DRAFT_203854 [Paraphoma chrysanthemicola]
MFIACMRNASIGCKCKIADAVALRTRLRDAGSRPLLFRGAGGGCAAACCRWTVCRRFASQSDQQRVSPLLARSLGYSILSDAVTMVAFTDGVGERATKQRYSSNSRMGSRGASTPRNNPDRPGAITVLLRALNLVCPIFHLARRTLGTLPRGSVAFLSFPRHSYTGPCSSQPRISEPCGVEVSGPSSGRESPRMYVFISQQLLNTHLPPIIATTLRLNCCILRLALENARV